MRLLLLGLNYAPEPVGIGPFTAGLAEWLVRRGHRVTVLCAPPYYPDWRVAAGAGGWWRRTTEAGVEVIRCPLYVPRRPTGPRRMLHHLSFAASASAWIGAGLARGRCRPDLVLSIAPSILSAWVARWVDAPHWLHVQDLEVEAAVATRQMPGGARTARWLSCLERPLLRADRVSSLSPAMCARLRAKGVAADRIVAFPNWATLDPQAPSPPPDRLRAELGIDRPFVALYAGTLCAKQGIGLILDAAQALAHRRDLLFLICGEGAERAALARRAAELDNVRLHPLQPAERLPELLGLASLHLLPQMPGAADLVLPSKLANMLASGRPVVASAAAGSGIAQEVAGCGRTVPPGDPGAFAAALAALIDDPAERAALGRAARRRASTRWDKERTLLAVEAAMLACAGAARGPGRRRSARRSRACSFRACRSPYRRPEAGKAERPAQPHDPGQEDGVARQQGQRRACGPRPRRQRHRQRKRGHGHARIKPCEILLPVERDQEVGSGLPQRVEQGDPRHRRHQRH
jgi:colanic acid biosynthesis glycosyl transferase WcaI